MDYIISDIGRMTTQAYSVTVEYFTMALILM